MKERNEFLEADGLFWESVTHEWFHDKTNTSWAVSERAGIAPCNWLIPFVVREKESGDYDRVLMDRRTNEIIFESKKLEDIAGRIDHIRVKEHFKNKNDE